MTEPAQLPQSSLTVTLSSRNDKGASGNARELSPDGHLARVAAAKEAAQPHGEWISAIEYSQGRGRWRRRSESRHAFLYATESLKESRRQGRARRGALSHAARALAKLQQGDANQAGHEALLALDLAGQITSSRTRETIKDLSDRLSAYKTAPEVNTFIERARAEFHFAA